MVKAWMAAALAAILLFAQASPDWVPSFQEAAAGLQHGDVAGAGARFESLWKAYPADPSLAVSIGAVLDAAGHHGEAVSWYQKALAVKPGYEPALNDLALNCAARGELPRAAGLLRDVVHANPQNARAWYNLGLIEVRLASWREAANAFRRAGEGAPPPAPPRQITLAEATALFHARDYAAVVEVVSRGAPTDDAAVLLLRGSAQALAGDLPGAVNTLQKSANLFPDNVQTYYRLALVFMQGHRDREAQDVLDAGLKQIPNAPLLLYADGLLKEVAGQYGEAVAWAAKSLEANPKQPEVQAFLGRVYAESGQMDEALKAYRRALEMPAAGIDIGVSLAELLIRLGDLHAAETQLSELARASPDNPVVERGQGALFRAEEKYPLAEQYLRRSIRHNPRDARAHFVLAEVLRLTGRDDDARKELAIYYEQKKVDETVRLLEVADSGG